MYPTNEQSLLDWKLLPFELVRRASLREFRQAPPALAIQSRQRIHQLSLCRLRLVHLGAMPHIRFASKTRMRSRK